MTPRRDPMDTILEVAGDHPDVMNTLGRFAGMLFSKETDDFNKAVATVAQELASNFASINNTVQRGQATLS